MTNKKLVYLGLGANLNSPIEQLRNATNALRDERDITLVASSSLYASKPMGPQDQPDYVNSVVAIETQLTPLQLLDITQKIELDFGRVRKEDRWGARTLDIDILLFGTQTIENERLTIPHYGMKVREFVLYPLQEIAPELILPCGTNLANLITTIDKNDLSIISAS